MKLMKIIVTMTYALVVSSCSPSLSGQLKGPEGQVVTSQEARVNISRLDGKGTGPIVVTVDSRGGFAADRSLAKGEYLVEALVPGYALCSKKIDLAEANEVELILAPLAPAKTISIGVNVDADVGRGAGGATLTPPNF